MTGMRSRSGGSLGWFGHKKKRIKTRNQKHTTHTYNYILYILYIVYNISYSYVVDFIFLVGHFGVGFQKRASNGHISCLLFVQIPIFEPSFFQQRGFCKRLCFKVVFEYFE